MYDIVSFIKSLDLGVIAGIIGAIGGLLGFWSFIDSYLLKFKPKITIGNKVIILTERPVQAIDSLKIKSINISVEIGNNRNKYGYINDFAVRIYEPNSLNPSQTTYFVTSSLKTLPVTMKSYDKEERTLYSPLHVLPKTNKLMVFNFDDVQNGTGMDIKGDSPQLNLEMYYQKEPKDAWIKINILSLFKTEQNSYDSALKIYSVLNLNSTRKKLLNNLKHPESSLFSGLSHKYVLQFISRLYSRLILIPLNTIKDFFLYVPITVTMLAVYLYDISLRKLIIRIYGSHLQSIGFSETNADRKPMTLKAFGVISGIFREETAKINVDAHADAKIVIQQSEQHVTISRTRLNLEVYIAGNTTIIAIGKDNSDMARINFKLDLKRTRGLYSYWYLEGYGPITLGSFSLRVLDAFLLHSSY